MTEDVNFGHRDQAADIDGESEISRAPMVGEVAVRGAAVAARVAAQCAGNTPTTPDRRLRYLVGVIAAPLAAEVGGTHQKHGAATTGGTLQFLTSRTLSERRLLHFATVTGGLWVIIKMPSAGLQRNAGR